jgi:hypothetical protein
MAVKWHYQSFKLDNCNLVAKPVSLKGITQLKRLVDFNFRHVDYDKRTHSARFSITFKIKIIFDRRIICSFEMEQMYETFVLQNWSATEEEMKDLIIKANQNFTQAFTTEINRTYLRSINLNTEKLINKWTKQIMELIRSQFN